MRGLADLLATDQGRRFLEANGVVTDRDAFAAAARHPVRPGLADAAGLPAGSRPVYVGQQVQLDYPGSVVAKFRAARGLEGTGVDPVLLWLDTDRTGAHREQASLVWAGPHGDESFRLVPQRTRSMETRFVPVDADRLLGAAAALEAWARRDGGQTAAERAAGVAAVIRGSAGRSLAEVNRAVAEYLLAVTLGLRAPSVFVSSLGGQGLLTPAIDEVVASLDDVVSVYNESLEELRARDVDPGLRPLDASYLPLNVSCAACGARNRLARERAGSDRTAVARCRCGRELRFHLGSRSLTVAEVLATGRWSPDVTLPVYLNDLVSGVVAGRSSALYGLVLNRVVDKVLGSRPVPVLVPPDLPSVLRREGAPTLLPEHVLHVASPRRDLDMGTITSSGRRTVK